MAENILFEETLHPGAAWSHVLKRGTSLRLTDTGGGANVGAIFYNADCSAERLNIPDTLKAQHIARLAQDFVLYSDMGRVLCSLTADSLGWHDALCGCLDAAAMTAKYGEARYQDCRNEFYKDAQSSFLSNSKNRDSGGGTCPRTSTFSAKSQSAMRAQWLISQDTPAPAASSNSAPR